MTQIDLSDEQLSKLLLDARTLGFSACATQFEDLLGRDLYPRLLGRLLSWFVADSDNNGRKCEELISEIPTETTIGERRFLFNFFMKEISESTGTGCYFIFQDYGAFTCFWIPTFVAMMKDYFKLVAYVDHTYAYRLLKPLDILEINNRFPDDPELMGKSNFDLIFRELLIEAAERNDTFTLLNYNLQHAAALAYLGKRDEAREKILSLLHRPYFSKYRNWIMMSLSSPTYHPDEGNIYL